MAFVITANTLLPAFSDKSGLMLLTLRDALVASGLWRLRGSGDGRNAVQLMGQTAGPYNVFTANPPYITNASQSAWFAVRDNSITQPRAWLVLEEIASGRCLMFQRTANTADPQGSATWISAICAGVASSGATGNTPPATVGPATFLTGAAWNNNTSGIAVDFSDDPTNMLVGANAEFWLQLGVSNVLGAGNVAPWWYAVWSKTANSYVSGAIWESLVDVDSGIVHPIAVVLAGWTAAFGRMTVSNSGGGYASSRWRGGDDFTQVVWQLPSNPTVGTTPPLTQQLNNAGKWRTERPLIYRPAVGTRHIGRLENYWLNKQPREYPSTYDIASASPRLTCGQLLVPWATGIVPSSSP